MTTEDRNTLTFRFARYDVTPDLCPEYLALSVEDRRNVLALSCALIRYERDRRGGPEQRRALRLLRTWLTPTQRRDLRNRREFAVTGSVGGRYRLRPATGAAQAVERHGTREFAIGTIFCLHDPAEILPPADVSLAHLLMLLTDELGFLTSANHHVSHSTLWDGVWLRRLHAARRARAEAA